jgi:hypothetical protein
LAALLAGAGCGKLAMDDTWRTQEIASDGRDGNWQHPLADVARKEAVIGRRHDGEFLCLRLASAERATRAQGMRYGAPPETRRGAPAGSGR